MDVGQSVRVSELTLPENCKAVGSDDPIVAQVIRPVAEDDDEDGEQVPGAMEPEVIGRKKEDDGGE